MFHLITFLLLTTAMSFSNSPSDKPNTSKKQPIPLTFRTVFPPLASYLLLKNLPNWEAEKMLTVKASTIGLTHRGLSESTAEKISHCAAELIKKGIDTRSFSGSDYMKTAGTIFLRELLFDEFSFFHTEDNIFFQIGQLVVKSSARPFIDRQLADIGKLYPKESDQKNLRDSSEGLSKMAFSDKKRRKIS